MDGILNVYKPNGITSYDVIRHIKRIVGQGWRVEGGGYGTENSDTKTRRSRLKIGHAGTLDPFAEGVLLILLGVATRLSSRFMSLAKVYRGVISLGFETDTGDATGKALEGGVSGVARPSLSFDELQKAADRFIGDIQQVPPAYSALRWGGRRLYDLARRGVKVSPQARKVTVYEFKILRTYGDQSEDSLDLRVRGVLGLQFEARVGQGCYIRSLARDFGRQLGLRAHLFSLTRVSIGPYHIDQAVKLDSLDSCEAVMSHLQPAESLTLLPGGALGPTAGESDL